MEKPREGKSCINESARELRGVIWRSAKEAGNVIGGRGGGGIPKKGKGKDNSKKGRSKKD